jgi:hypothetical protein
VDTDGYRTSDVQPPLLRTRTRKIPARYVVGDSLYLYLSVRPRSSFARFVWEDHFTDDPQQSRKEIFIYRWFTPLCPRIFMKVEVVNTYVYFIEI